MNTAAMRAHWAQAPRSRIPMLAVVPAQPEELIVQMTAVRCRVTLAELLSPSCRRPVSRARWVAMLVLAEGLGWGPSRIGAWLDRDHSTVCHGLGRARADAAICRDAQQVRLLVDERLQAHGVR